MRAIIQLHRGRSAIARLIQWQTRSRLSHASVWFPEARCVIESKEFRGVQWRRADDYAAERQDGRARCFEVPGLTTPQALDILRFMQDEVGQGYDYSAIVKFVSRRSAPHDTRWFCSELVFAAFASVGVTLLKNVEAWAVSPGDLAKSPLLEEVSPIVSRIPDVRALA